MMMQKAQPKEEALKIHNKNKKLKDLIIWLSNVIMKLVSYLTT